MLAINQPRVSHLDRASRIGSTISLDKAAAWHSFISSSSLSGLNADFLNYRSALSNPTPQRRVLWVAIQGHTRARTKARPATRDPLGLIAAHPPIMGCQPAPFGGKLT